MPSPKPYALKLSGHAVQGWQAQYIRQQRWLARFLGAQTKEDKLDFVITYFQNAYHLRDWLRILHGDMPAKLDGFFAKNIELRLCQDICHMTKHVILTAPAVDKDSTPSIIRVYGRVDGWYGVNAGLSVRTPNIEYDLKDLALRCSALWSEFVATQELTEDVRKS